jgi:hypothetical protein
MHDPKLDPFRVKLVSVDEPIARAAEEFQSSMPGRHHLASIQSPSTGLSVAEMYLYSAPIATNRP